VLRPRFPGLLAGLGLLHCTGRAQLRGWDHANVGRDRLGDCSVITRSQFSLLLPDWDFARCVTGVLCPREFR
jgi:hypothetical protein